MALPCGRASPLNGNALGEVNQPASAESPPMAGSPAFSMAGRPPLKLIGAYDPTNAITWSWSMSWRTAAPLRPGSPPSSTITSLTCRPLMPPLALTACTHVRSDSHTAAPWAPTTPDSVPTAPMTIGGPPCFTVAAVFSPDAVALALPPVPAPGPETVPPAAVPDPVPVDAASPPAGPLASPAVASPAPSAPAEAEARCCWAATAPDELSDTRVPHAAVRSTARLATAPHTRTRPRIVVTVTVECVVFNTVCYAI